MESPTKHIRPLGRHFGVSYAVSFWQRVHGAFTPFLVIVALFVALRFSAVFPFIPANVSLQTVLLALLATFIRLIVAYALALVISLPLALLITKSAAVERLLLPLFDIAQSIPVLAFFPLVIVFFVRFGLNDAAAVFIIFLAMLWNLVFSLVGGLNVMPTEIKSAAQVFGVRGFDFTRKIVLPATVPYVVTGSLLAWAQGWNIIIVAEVLHTYIPGGTPSNDLFGIGSMLVNATATGENGVFIVSILAMVLLIGVLNFFVWQRLLTFSERFKFE